MATFRNPGGHGKSTHARTATFDVSDFSRTQVPVESNTRLARNATMDNPRTAAQNQFNPHQVMQPQAAQSFQNTEQMPGGAYAGMVAPMNGSLHSAHPSAASNAGRKMSPERLRGNMGSFVEPRSSAVMELQHKMALEQQMAAMQPGMTLLQNLARTGLLQCTCPVSRLDNNPSCPESLLSIYQEGTGEHFNSPVRQGVVGQPAKLIQNLTGTMTTSHLTTVTKR